MASEILVDYTYLGPGNNIAGAIVMLLLCIPAAIARFWGRARANIGFKSDDWLILISLVLFLGMTICIFIGVARHALGYPTPKAPPGSPKDSFLFFTSPEQQLIGKLEQAIFWQQVWQLGCAKASVIMFYRRIFNVGKPKRWFQICTIALLTLVVLWTVAFFFTLLFDCGTNFSANWTTVIALEKECTVSQQGHMAMVICDFLIDMPIICLPFPLVWELHMPFSRKLAVSAVFLLGALAVAASCLRMAIYITVDVSFVNPKQDGDWTVDIFLFWSIIESGLTILAACLPSLAFFDLGQTLGIVKSKALHSLRSVFSLQSMRSTGTSSGEMTSGAELGRFDSADSQIHMTRIQGGNDWERGIGLHKEDEVMEKGGRDGIIVVKSFTQRDNIV